MNPSNASKFWLQSGLLPTAILCAMTACSDQLLTPDAVAIRGKVVVHQEGNDPEIDVTVLRRFPPLVWFPLLAATNVLITDRTSGPPYHLEFEIPRVPPGEYFIGAIRWGNGWPDDDLPGVIMTVPEMQGMLGGMCAASRGENKVVVGTEPIENLVIHVWGENGKLDPCFAEEAAALGDAGAGDAALESSDPYEGFDEPCALDQSPGAAPFTSQVCSDNAPYCIPWPLDATEGHCSGAGCFDNPERCPPGWICIAPADFGVEGFDEQGGACANTAWLSGG